MRENTSLKAWKNKQSVVGDGNAYSQKRLALDLIGFVSICSTGSLITRI